MSQSFTRIECITFALLSSALSSVATLLKTHGVSTVHPLAAAPIGLLIAGIPTLLYLSLRKQLPTIAALTSEWRSLALLVLCRPVLANLLFTIGLSMTSGVKAIFLTKMEPYLVIFWTWVLDKKVPSRDHLLLLIIHIAGAMILSAGGTEQLFEGCKGDFIILLSVITAALSYRVAPKVTVALTPTQTAALSETAGGLLTLPLAFAFVPVIYSPTMTDGWLLVATHSILFYAIAVPLLYSSLKGIEGWLSSALRAVGPLIALPVGWICFGDRLSAVQMAGALMVIVTSYLVARRKKVA